MKDDHEDDAGGKRAVDYSSEMGGGASSTGQIGEYNEGARVRSIYDHPTDEPGSFDEEERPDEEETLT
jgi:hypothetical protein